jgi:hypothetical protein
MGDSSLDLWVSGCTILIWIVTLVFLRRRRASLAVRILFTVGILGFLLGDFLLQQGMSSALRVLAKRTVAVPIWIASLTVAGIGFYKKKLLSAYLPFALAISLIFSTVVFGNALRSSISYAAYGIALLLFLVSFILTVRRDRRTENN